MFRFPSLQFIPHIVTLLDQFLWIRSHSPPNSIFFPSTSHVCKYHEPKRNASELTLVWGLGFLRRSWSVGHSAQWQVKTRLANCPLFNPNGFYGFAENKHYPVVHRLFTFLLVFIFVTECGPIVDECWLVRSINNEPSNFKQTWILR